EGEAGRRLGGGVAIFENEDEPVARSHHGGLLADRDWLAVGARLDALDQHLAGQRDVVGRHGGGGSEKREKRKPDLHGRHPSQSICALTGVRLVVAAATGPRPAEIAGPVKLPEAAAGKSVSGPRARVREPAW